MTQAAEICRDGKGRPEPDSELRETENIPLPPGTALPLPMRFGPDMPNDDLVEAMRPAIDAYIAAEVLPHVPDAWVDYAKTKVGYEIPINRHFYVYKPPRPLARDRGGYRGAGGRDCWAAQGVGGVKMNGNLALPVGWGHAPLKRLTRFGYGDALAADNRDPGGSVAVYGSNGPFDVTFSRQIL